MPYSVERLIENQGSVVVVRKEDAIAAALDLMIERDFSQLPVVDENQTLLGMVTYESILRADCDDDIARKRQSCTDSFYFPAASMVWQAKRLF